MASKRRQQPRDRRAEQKLVPPNPEDIHLGISGTGPERPYVMLKYYDDNHQCFSAWGQTELQQFSKFCRKLRTLDWFGIYRDKGLKYTKLPPTYFKTLPDGVTNDQTFFELRINEKARVHGFRAKEAFCLMYLDNGHDVTG